MANAHDIARRDRAFDAILYFLMVVAGLTILFVLAGELPIDCRDSRWEVCVFASGGLNGLVQWVGTGLGIGGFLLAWLELRASRTSTEAATAALRDAQIKSDHEQKGYLMTGGLRAADGLKGCLASNDIGGARAYLKNLRQHIVELQVLNASGFDYIDVRSKLDALSGAMSLSTFTLTPSSLIISMASTTHVSDALQTLHRHHISGMQGRG